MHVTSTSAQPPLLRDENLDRDLDDYIRCTNCDHVGLVRVGTDQCPSCGQECLVDEEKPY